MATCTSHRWFVALVIAAALSIVTRDWNAALAGGQPSAGLPMSVTTGPDGNLWVADFAQHRILRVTTMGAVTAFPLPTPGAYPAKIVGPTGITVNALHLNLLNGVDLVLASATAHIVDAGTTCPVP